MYIQVSDTPWKDILPDKMLLLKYCFLLLHVNIAPSDKSAAPYSILYLLLAHLLLQVLSVHP